MHWQRFASVALALALLLGFATLAYASQRTKLYEPAEQVAAKFQWYFVTVDPRASRWIFGPWYTRNDCHGARNSQAITDRWVMVSECAKWTDGLMPNCRGGCKQSDPP